jgi:mono/diheme cytochrome c family protein
MIYLNKSTLFFWLLVAYASTALTPVPNNLSADEVRTGDQEPLQFNRDIRPILSAACFRCHGADKNAREANLRLDQPADTGPNVDEDRAITAGKPDESKLFFRITSADHSERMPPPDEVRQLSDPEIKLLRRWIEEGARYEPHWAFIAPKPLSLPEVDRTSWPINAVDHFVLKRLEQHGLRPSQEADKTTLIRRLYLDLLGIVPRPKEVDEFLADKRPDSFERLVDRLLASPHFGERFARHWMDLARYGDSNGYSGDGSRPWAYRWRDWLIDAINTDLPYDRFTIEQLAGDLLEDRTIQQQIATGFHRNTLTNSEGGSDKEEYRVRQVVDRTNTTASVWLGLTVGCCECHDHKYDPLTQREYYGLFAFFNNAEEADIAAAAAGHPKSAKAQAIVERTERIETHVHVRGNFLDHGEQVQPHTFAALPPLQPRRADTLPDRLDLARWLIHPDNPLTSRVAANRVWHWLFGKGIVETTEDLGTQGSRPTHPQLLDWLAAEFIRHGWSRKQTIRRIVTSATYRQSSRIRLDLLEIDPDNELLARQNRFRVEGEVVRDVLLSSSGLLQTDIGGPSVRPPLPDGAIKGTRFKWPASKPPDSYRRSLYIFTQRTMLYPMMGTFDGADPNVSCSRRSRSNTPLHALVLMNESVVLDSSRALVHRLFGDRKLESDRRRLAYAMRLVVGRQPTVAELNELASLYDEQLRLCRGSPTAAAQIAALDGESTAIPTDEFAAWVMVARTLFNLDETITRE